MDKSELLAEFKAQLDQFDKYRTFIEKARSYAERFNPAVVEKVIADNTAKIDGVASVLDPLLNNMRAVIEDLEEQRGAVLSGVEASRMEVEELELRQVIGEIDEDAFNQASGDLKTSIEEADSKVAGLDGEIADFSATLQQWLDNRPGDALALEEPEDEEDDLLGEFEEDDGVDLEDDEEDDLLGFEDAEEPGDLGVHSERVSMADDVSSVFDDDVIEADDAGGIDFGPGEIDDLGDDLFSEPKEEAPADEDGQDGQGVLILGEGTSEEHIYPLSGDVLSLGRGRDNNVQVKNDSKVSRYHCKLFRRSGHYFIADNKSANGTLVDGELITEKRLVGGEEVIIGETFFRFRIQH